ncbi:hypothetical protein BASA81_012691 [Batrachochytrium salamandrivorans]|nr:hypothetical protein BASA81_012691 [Batrachochytrium salamandrivorans]
MSWLLLLLLVAMGALGHASNEAEPESVRVLSHSQVCVPEHVVKLGDYALVHFTAQIDQSSAKGTKGEVLQNSNEVGVPIIVQFKPEEILDGWIQGLVGVACEGSVIEVVVPPSLGFGEDLTVLFTINLLKVSSDPIEEPSLFDVIDINSDGQVSLGEFEFYFKEKRPTELTKDGKAPTGLFFKDDVNQNKHLSWHEFSGPKGTEPPTLAKAIVDRELADPKLTKHKKGDPLLADFKLDLEGKPINEEADFDKFKADVASAAHEHINTAV